jgi:hypothetical protein
MPSTDSGESMAPSTAEEPHGDVARARELVMRAYALALAGGREEWRRMSIAVLKNRLLDMTDREFDEAKWGVGGTRAFVGLLDDIVELDDTTKPSTVVLRDEIDVEPAVQAAVSESARRGGNWRVRRDLWDAVLDFGSGSVYVWDGQTAVRRPPGGAPGDTATVLPTTTAEELNTWRAQYAGEILGTANETSRPQIEQWRDAPVSSQLLPPALRARWFGVLKTHVRARLEEWFAERAEDPPRDLVTTAAGAPGVDDTERLRAFVLHAVERMNRTELEALSLPVSSIAGLLR